MQRLQKPNIAIYIYTHTRLVSIVNKACEITKEKRSYDSTNVNMTGTQVFFYIRHFVAMNEEEEENINRK